MAVGPTTLFAETTRSADVCRFVERRSGETLVTLQRHRYEWTCADGPLVVDVLAVEPIVPLIAEPSEPRFGALARLRQAHALPGALLCLRQPAQVCEPERALAIDGIRFIGLGDAADESWWTACLDAGLLCYALGEGLQLDLAGRVEAAAVFEALAFGAFVTGRGPAPEQMTERPGRVAWQLGGPGRVTIVARGGFDVFTSTEPEGSWQESGHEGVVRVLFERDGGGRWWSQPRLVGRPGAALR